MILNSFKNADYDTFQPSEGGTGCETYSELKYLINNMLYPVGSLYITESSENPSIFTGIPESEWQLIEKGVYLYGNDGTYTTGNVIGSNTLNLNQSHLPAHVHTLNSSVSGGSHSHTVSGRSYSSWNEVQIETFEQSVYPEIMIGDGDGDHTHSFSGNTSSTGSSVNLSLNYPYRGVYIWKRISHTVSPS